MYKNYSRSATIFQQSQHDYNIITPLLEIFFMMFENIRNLREDNDLRQEQLADLLHIKQTTYSKYELGKINIPIEVFITLADFYDTSIDYLVGRTPKK